MTFATQELGALHGKQTFIIADHFITMVMPIIKERDSVLREHISVVRKTWVRQGA